MHYTVNLFSTFLENSIKKISDGLQGIMYVDYFQLYQTRFFFFTLVHITIRVSCQV